MRKISLFVLLILLLLILNPAKFKEIDEYNYYWVTDSLFNGKGITIHQGLLIGIRNSREGQYFFGKEGIDGFYSPYGPFLSFINFPNYLFSHIISKYLGLNEAQREVLLWYGSIMLNAVILVLMIYIFYCVYSSKNKGDDYIIPGLIAFGSIVLYYGQSFYAEVLMSFLILIGFLFLVFSREDAYYFLSGFFYGLATVTKINAVIFIPCFIIYLWLEERNKRLFLKKVFMFFLPVLFLIMFALNFNYVRFGSFFDFGYPDVDEFGESMAVFVKNPFAGLFALVFSPGKGIIFYFPLIILYLLKIREYLKREKNITLFSLSVLALSLLFYSMWKHYEGGTCFGSRFLVTAVVMIVLNIAVAGDIKGIYYRTRFYRYAFIFLLVMGIIVNLGGALIDFSYYSVNVNGHYYTGPGDPQIRRELPEEMWRFAGDYNIGFSPFFGMYGFLWKNITDLGEIKQCAQNYSYDRLYISSFEFDCIGGDLDISPVRFYKAGIGIGNMLIIYMFSVLLSLGAVMAVRKLFMILVI